MVFMRCPLRIEHIVTQDLQLEVYRPPSEVIVNVARAAKYNVLKGLKHTPVMFRVSVSELNMTSTITALKS